MREHQSEEKSLKTMHMSLTYKNEKRVEVRICHIARRPEQRRWLTTKVFPQPCFTRHAWSTLSLRASLSIRLVQFKLQDKSKSSK